MHEQDKDGQNVEHTIFNCQNDCYIVMYTPDDVSMYTVNVMYGGQPVPGAPYNVTTSPTGDASKVKIPS